MAASKRNPKQHRSARRSQQRRRRGGGPSVPFESLTPHLPASSPCPLWLAILLPCLVAVGAFVTYLPALDAGFVEWDDDKVITENPFVRGLDSDRLEWMFTKEKMGHYQPLTWLSYAIEFELSQDRFPSLDETARQRYDSGFDPYIVHLTNLLIHAGVAVGLYFLALILLRITLPPAEDRPDYGAPVAAAIAALLFACHPLRVESVAWATERRDVLSSLFLVPALYFYIRYAVDTGSVARKLLLYGTCFVFLALSLLGKAWGITLPAVMLVLDVYPLRRLGGRIRWLSERSVLTVLEKIPFLALCGWFAFRASKAQQDQIGTVKTLQEWSAADRVSQAIYGLFFYAKKTLIPTHLTPLVELPVHNNPLAVRYLIAAVFVVGVAVLLFLFRRRWPAGIVAAIIYVGVISPVLGFHQSGPQLVADRYSYLACMTWAVAAGAGVLWLMRRRKTVAWARRAVIPVTVAALAFISVCAALAWKQTKVWQRSKSLWKQALAVDPNCRMAHTNLGMMARLDGRIAEAMEHYRLVLAQTPDDAILLNNMAVAVQKDTSRPRKQRLEEALDYAKRAVELRPKHHDIRVTLGTIYEALGDYDNAIEEYKMAIAIRKPTPYPKGHRKLGQVYLTVARQTRDAAAFDRAVAQFEIALNIERQMDPRSRNVIYSLDRLGYIASLTGHINEALDYYHKILDIDPDNEPALRGIKRLGG